jgi:hypothetical protein
MEEHQRPLPGKRLKQEALSTASKEQFQQGLLMEWYLLILKRKKIKKRVCT